VFNNQTRTCNDPNNNLYTVSLSQQSGFIDNSWQFYPKLQNKGRDLCGTHEILGSTSIQYRSLKITRNFTNLPPHEGIIIHLFFYQIDDFDGITNDNTYDIVNFKLNNVDIPYNISKFGYNLCGNSSYDSINKVILTYGSHSS
jgi:hypothetical protein